MKNKLSGYASYVCSEMCANTYDDVEPVHAKFIATNLPILKK